MRWARLALVAVVGGAPIAPACGSDDSGGGRAPGPDAASDAASEADVTGGLDADADAGGSPPGFERFCLGKSWRESFEPALVGDVSGDYVGSLTTDFGSGMLETVKVVPEHPFAARTIRVAFAEGSGTARIRLMHTFGRTYPASMSNPTWPDHPSQIDLVPPVEISVQDAEPDAWVEIPIPETLLSPTQHYMIVYEHLGPEPRLSIGAVADGDVHRSLIFDSKNPSGTPSGFDGNYRMQLAGDHFCAWAEPEKAFSRSEQPIANVASGWVGVADVDVDGHDDLALAPATGPELWRGDGMGGFTRIEPDPLPDLPAANFLLFGDLDGDGDEDAFGSQYVQTDADGDGAAWDTDCDDTSADVKPGAVETTNGTDDDCDGSAHEATNTDDADGDGVSIAAGDCDDTRAEAYPGATELPNARDDDCDGSSDEIFAPKILENDGSGHFLQIDNPDVEFVGPSSAAAFGDANGDGALELYAGYWLVTYPNFPAIPSRYYAQAGGQLTLASAAAGIAPSAWRPVYGVIWTDFDDDGDSDIYVSNYQLSDNFLWKNAGDGTFSDVAASVNAAHDAIETTLFGYPGGHSYGTDVGDIDNDGDLDLFVPNIAHPRVQPWSDPSMLLVSSGAPEYTFDNRRVELGLLYDEGDVNAAFADYDNDGDLDLYVASTYESHYGRLYRNDGALGFVDVSYETASAIHQSQTAVWLDADEDGDLDLVVTSPGPGANVQLLMNRVGQQQASLTLELVGTTANRTAIGARVLLQASGTSQIREVSASSRHQSSRRVHFGLGTATSIDSLEVRWPGGPSELVTGAQPGGRYRIVQGSGTATPL